MMKILVTGGGGFVGSHVVEAELENGNEVTAVDIASPSKLSHLGGRKGFNY